MTFSPKPTVLPGSQWALWKELKAAPKHFVLFGGTALALRLGHNVSTDFDFLTNATFGPQELAERIPYLLRWQSHLALRKHTHSQSS
jgi:Nucleotidyl transferase AbiEii toxin, Type IV TA system